MLIIMTENRSLYAPGRSLTDPDVFHSQRKSFFIAKYRLVLGAVVRTTVVCLQMGHARGKGENGYP
jgi:hypothetical protein